MRILPAVLLLAPMIAFAADPFVGTWKFDPARSISTSAAPQPKEVTIVIVEHEGELHVALTGTEPNGKPLVNKFSAPPTGGAAKLDQSPYSGITVKFISPTIRDLTYSFGGKEVSSQHAFLTADGNILCLVERGVNQQGVPNENVSVFVKQ